MNTKLKFEACHVISNLIYPNNLDKELSDDKNRTIINSIFSYIAINILYHMFYNHCRVKIQHGYLILVLFWFVANFQRV